MPKQAEREAARSRAIFPGSWRAGRVSPLLKRVKVAVSSRVKSERLLHRVRNGFRLVPEEAYEACVERLLDRLQEEDPREPRGDYLEFGVCHGASVACMYRVTERRGLTSMRLFGFDSFEGLPAEAAAPEEGPWQPGQYRSPIDFTRRFLDAGGIDWQRTELIKGWFSDTLTDETRERYGISHASVIMVDCDIYSSASEALRFCAPLIHERAAILFDDWHAAGLAERGQGEKRAFHEFLGAHPEFEAIPEPAYGRNSEAFILHRRQDQRRR